MSQEPLIEDARRAGQAYVDSFKGDWKALLADLRRRSEAEGRQAVSLPPKAPKARPATTRKVG
jgi:hypothetical protein